jgi:hypothetical protein
LENSQKILGKFSENSWKILGKFLENSQKILGKFSENSWKKVSLKGCNKICSKLKSLG